MLRIKRIYDAPKRTDGYRILVDRLWPRGMAKTEAHVDLWLKDIAPSAALRRWFQHDPAKWKIFAKKYRAEIARNREGLTALRRALRGKTSVTLLFAAKDPERNNAVVLRDVLSGKTAH